MSTIHACFNPQQPVESNIVEKMLTASCYWQPDATSQKSNPQLNCYIAKATLFNTERSKKDNVYQDLSTGSIISANARLDNRSEIAYPLGLTTEELSTLTDGQLILKAYQHWGEACPNRLLGDFVFIIWDEANQRLFCARDHFGVKVLYHCQNSHGFMITNEHNAFFTTHWQSKQIKESWLVRHLWGQGPKPVESPYHGIEVLPPAHSISIDGNGVTISRYWSLEDKNDWLGMEDEALIDELKSRFQQAVKVRLDSAYPLGTELSEGLDSNGIAGYAAKILDEQPLYTFSYQCEALTDKNRSVWEKTYQDIYGMLDLHSNLKPVWITEPQQGEHLEQLTKLSHHAGGVFDMNGGHFLRSRLAQQQGVRVLLSGWGGDHCVTAPGDFYESELFNQGRLLTLHRLIREKYRRGRGMKPVKGWIWLLLKHLTPGLFHSLLRYRCGLEKALWQRAKQSILKQSYINRYNCKKRLRQFTNHYQRYSVKAYHHRELFDVGVERRLVESELSARLFRLEYRYPMLDVRLVELAYNMPSHLKIYNGIERYMFRRVLEGVTTNRIQWRRKADVEQPQHHNIGKETEHLVKARIRKFVCNSKIVQKYCDIDKVDIMLNDTNNPETNIAWNELEIIHLIEKTY